MKATSDRMHDYYVAREAQELRLEAAAGTRDRWSTDDVDLSRFYVPRAYGGAGERPITLRMWLEQTGAKEPSPAEVERVHVNLVQDAHQQVQDAYAAYMQACEVRRVALTDANNDGLSLRTLGFLLADDRHPNGISGQAVRKAMSRTGGDQ